MMAIAVCEQWSCDMGKSVSTMSCTSSPYQVIKVAQKLSHHLEEIAC